MEHGAEHPAKWSPSRLAELLIKYNFFLYLEPNPNLNHNYYEIVIKIRLAVRLWGLLCLGNQTDDISA